MPSTEPGTAQAPAPAHLPLSRGRPEGMRGPAALLLPPPAARAVVGGVSPPSPAPPRPARPPGPAPPARPARWGAARDAVPAAGQGRAGQGTARVPGAGRRPGLAREVAAAPWPRRQRRRRRGTEPGAGLPQPPPAAGGRCRGAGRGMSCGGPRAAGRPAGDRLAGAAAGLPRPFCRALRRPRCLGRRPRSGP